MKDRECVGRSDERGEISHDRGSKFPHGNNNLTALRPIGEREVAPTETRSSKDTMGPHGKAVRGNRLPRCRPKCLLGMDLALWGGICSPCTILSINAAG